MNAIHLSFERQSINTARQNNPSVLSKWYCLTRPVIRCTNSQAFLLKFKIQIFQKETIDLPFNIPLHHETTNRSKSSLAAIEIIFKSTSAFIFRSIKIKSNWSIICGKGICNFNQINLEHDVISFLISRTNKKGKNDVCEIITGTAQTFLPLIPKFKMFKFNQI